MWLRDGACAGRAAKVLPIESESSGFFRQISSWGVCGSRTSATLSKDATNIPRSGGENGARIKVSHWRHYLCVEPVLPSHVG